MIVLYCPNGQINYVCAVYNVATPEHDELCLIIRGLASVVKVRKTGETNHLLL
ncbi:MAG TPA: hypothetical protein PLW77_01450 [Bacteroidales bacterium]|nr:hypothetical protein [Bacteroidales bacterium]